MSNHPLYKVEATADAIEPQMGVCDPFDDQPNATASTKRDLNITTGRMPLSVRFSVPAVMFPKQLSSARELRITFSKLRGEKLIATRLSGLDPYIIFDAPFIERGNRTAVLRNVRYPPPPPPGKMEISTNLFFLSLFLAFPSSSSFFSSPAYSTD